MDFSWASALSFEVGSVMSALSPSRAEAVPRPPVSKAGSTFPGSNRGQFTQREISQPFLVEGKSVPNQDGDWQVFNW